MQSLVKNVEVNERLIARQSATSIASSTLYGLEKIRFESLQGLLAEANIAAVYSIELNEGNCNSLTPITYLEPTTDELLCDQIFNLVSNEFSPEATKFRIFIYNYFTPQNFVTTGIPSQVLDVIPAYDAGNTATADTLLRVTVWIEYYNDPPYYVVLSGLIFNEEK